MKQYFYEYIYGNGVDQNTDENSNSVDKSFNNFRSQISNDPLRKLTEDVFEDYAGNFGYEDENTDFWQKENDGTMYFHDKTQAMIPYCFAMDSSFLVGEGRKYGQLHSVPAKRSDSFIAQLIEAVMDMSQEFAGAIAIPDFFVNYSRFTLKEKRTYKDIENDFQKLIHVFNNQFRVGGQSPFTNLSIMDRELIKNNYEIHDELLIEEIMKNQKIFIRFFIKGDPSKGGAPLRFPVVTVNIFYDKEQGGFKDQEFFNWFSRKGNNGNFNIYITKDIGMYSSCCRMQNDLKLMMKYLNIDSFGNAGKSIGSHRVISLNLVKILKQFKIGQSGKTNAIDYLKHCMDLATIELFLHKQILKDNIEAGFLKFFKPLGWADLDRNFFSTIGFVGLFESCNGDVEQMYDIIKLMKDYTFELSDRFNLPINLEQIPAEAAAIKLAKGTEYDILSNQYLPLWYDFNVIDRLKIAGRFDKEVTGGAITHVNVDHKMTEGQFRKLLIFAAEQGVNHFAINYIYSECSEGHISNGKLQICGICGAKIVDYITRIIGYFTPVSSWSEGRREEFKKRHFEHSTKI